MKYKLVKPDLSSLELAKLNFYANYLGWFFKFDIARKSALFETIDKEVGYVQKDEYGHLFIVWKKHENIDYIDDKIKICMKLNNIKIIEPGFNIKEFTMGIFKVIYNLV